MVCRWVGGWMAGRHLWLQVGGGWVCGVRHLVLWFASVGGWAAMHSWPSLSSMATWPGPWVPPSPALRTSTRLPTPALLMHLAPPFGPAGNAASVRFIRNTPGLVPLAEKQASKLRDTALIERRLVQAIVAPSSPLAGGWW